jgi:Bacterial Ig domain
MMQNTLRPWKWSLAAAFAAGIFLANTATAQRFPHISFVSVQATDPLASEPGDNPGMFTISREGDTNEALTIPFTLTGTASNGVDYVSIPTTITLAAGEYSSNIVVTPIAEPDATGYKTVKLTLGREHVERGQSPPYIVGALNHALVYIAYNYTNVPPAVTLVCPTNGSSYLSQPNILLAATASDSNGWVTSVQFLANSNSVGTVSNSPFSGLPLQPFILRESRGSVMPILPGHHVNRFQFVWTNVPPGDYSLQAVATDNAGLESTSAVVEITVTTNLPTPEVQIIYPANGSEFPDQTPIHILAEAGEKNGVVDTVEFFANGTSIGTDTNYLVAEPLEAAQPLGDFGPIQGPPFRPIPYPPFPPSPVPPIRPIGLPFNFTWTNAPVGSNVLTAVATDNNGTSVTSAPVTISVTTNMYHHHHPWW